MWEKDFLFPVYPTKKRPLIECVNFHQNEERNSVSISGVSQSIESTLSMVSQKRPFSKVERLSDSFSRLFVSLFSTHFRFYAEKQQSQLRPSLSCAGDSGKNPPFPESLIKNHSDQVGAPHFSHEKSLNISQILHFPGLKIAAIAFLSICLFSSSIFDPLFCSKGRNIVQLN